jgi:hypothetical protein
LSQIGSQEGAPGSSTPNTGTGLAGELLQQHDAGREPCTRTCRDGQLQLARLAGRRGQCGQLLGALDRLRRGYSTGNFQFQTRSNAGVRLWINGNLVIDNWAAHATVTDTTGDIAMTKNQRYSVTLEMYDTTNTAVAKLYWKRPGQTTFIITPGTRLYAN